MCKNNNVKFQTNIVKGTAYPWLILLFYENIDVLRKLKKECKDEKLKIVIIIIFKTIIFLFFCLI